MKSPYLLLALAPLFWSCNWILGRALHQDVPPMGMTFFRWLFAVLILAPVAIRPLRRDWAIVRANWRVMLLLGATGVGLHNALTYLGLNFTTATNGVILNSCIPVMIIVMARVFFGERMRRLQLAGVAISLLGVLAIFSRGSWQTIASLRLNAGDFFVMLSVAMWSLYTILLRHRPAGLHMLSFLFSIAVVGNLCMLPFWVGELLLGYRIAWTTQTVSALLAVALFSSVLAYIFWNRGVEAVGAQVAGLFVHLMPVYGVMLAWFFLGERLYPYHVAGIALILIGIVLTTRPAAPVRNRDVAGAVGETLARSPRK